MFIASATHLQLETKIANFWSEINKK